MKDLRYANVVPQHSEVANAGKGVRPCDRYSDLSEYEVDMRRRRTPRGAGACPPPNPQLANEHLLKTGMTKRWFMLD
ncbi:hypothetical protein MSG28_008578 [Choristoneura fumiferana]|uniref:Uncharacterized protein n=1 Tax=Choristoneura fumiferana TaxID=7141 RepID=A0ACC0J790_CHOFU|nr:hypothetical protein MSG28_008578 [Choristoneura fumiferana]